MPFFSGKYASRYIDKIYDQLANLDGKDNGIAAPELYVGILLLFNNINKFSPGKWVDPPKRAEVFKMLEAFDYNNDKTLNKDEFRDFCGMFFPNITRKVLRDLAVTFFVAPLAVWFAVRHLRLISKILPEAVLGTLLVALLQATGALRFLDNLLDKAFPAQPLPPPGRPGVASAYPYGGGPPASAASAVPPAPAVGYPVAPAAGVAPAAVVQPSAPAKLQ